MVRARGVSSSRRKHACDVGGGLQRHVEALKVAPGRWIVQLELCPSGRRRDHHTLLERRVGQRRLASDERQQADDWPLHFDAT